MFRSVHIPYQKECPSYNSLLAPEERAGRSSPLCILVTRHTCLSAPSPLSIVKVGSSQQVSRKKITLPLGGVSAEVIEQTLPVPHNVLTTLIFSWD